MDQDLRQVRQDLPGAKLVVYKGSTSTGCGYGDAATGPFYCPLDERVYLDLTFFSALEKQLHAPGDFAQAYVIGHEIGHHVQKQLGGMGARRSAGENGESVKTELQADCYAGVWASSTKQRNLLEAGDIEEAIEAASAVGDDRLEAEAGKPVRPERWTHGSAKSRAAAFKAGLQAGDPAACAN